ncbi:MAG: MTAP family purine nucleoside phosphorylase [Solirubrobacterales bacterium]|nr:MTAP family purine nucleoside phosphorylase [Solirubrobacterales bacterium]
MAIGIITGSGGHDLLGFSQSGVIQAETPFGSVPLRRGTLGGADVLHVSRHGEGHQLLSSGVNHRANIWALKEAGATAVLAATVCGAVDASLALGSLVVFDDLHFLANRLPDGSLCTFFDRPGDPARGHWILHGGPFSDVVRSALLDACVGVSVRDGGCYGHVDGPRFNTPTEIRQLAGAGVVAVSQTAGPEVVLCGELELPYGLIGFITDHANEVVPGATTPVAKLLELMAASPRVLAGVLERAAVRLAGQTVQPAGFMYRFES